MPHSLHMDIVEGNDALCIGATKTDGHSKLYLWSFEKIMMQAVAAEQKVLSLLGKPREELERQAHEWLEPWLRSEQQKPWSAVQEHEFHSARQAHTLHMQRTDALLWHTHCNQGNDEPLFWFNSLRCVAGMICGASVNHSCILKAWDAVSGHRLFTKSLRHRVSAVVASGHATTCQKRSHFV